MSDNLQNLIGKRVNVLDKGWVELVDLMPHPQAEASGDLAIVNAARVSFLGESKGAEQDKKLLFYLLRNHHTSPFEMVEFKFRVRAPLVTWWQWARHRVWNFNAQCLDGDTVIMFNRPDKVRIGQNSVGSKITLADLYERWQDPYKRKRVKEMYLRSVNEDSMLLESSHIGNIVHAGVKHGFKVIMKNGKEIICSADHQFLFEDGWATLGDATGLQLVNDKAVYKPDLPSLYMNGKPLATRNLYDNYDWLYYQYHTKQLTIEKIAQLAQCSTHTVRKYLKIHQLTSTTRSKNMRFQDGSTPWNKGVSYSLDETPEERLNRSLRAKASVKKGADCHFWRGGISSKRALIGEWTRRNAKFVYERDNYTCAYCGRGLDEEAQLHAHHIIPVWANPKIAKDMDNLITLHKTCHQHIHANHLEREFAEHIRKNKGLAFDINFTIPDKMDRYANLKVLNGHATPHLIEIQSIEYVGERTMYDIVVDGDYPNFVANWFIVHNSGRYTPFEENDFYVPDVWRRQAKDNKQASEGRVTDAENNELTEELIAHYDEGFRLYEKALKTGVSREMARLFLPGFSVYYTWVTKVDAHNLMHFLRLRMASDAQYEIRVFADVIYNDFFKPALPWTAEAFEKYRLNPSE
ncbi:MAG: FAD-dependent thymidylate synthase [Phototrophicaceae bacterium]